MEGKKIIVKQVKSSIGQTKNQKLVLESLGLRGIGKSVEHYAVPSVLGMVKKVSHIVSVISKK